MILMLNRRKYCSVHNFDILKIPTPFFIPSVSIECPLKKNSHNCVYEASTSRWRGLIRGLTRVDKEGVDKKSKYGFTGRGYDSRTSRHFKTFLVRWINWELELLLK